MVSRASRRTSKFVVVFILSTAAMFTLMAYYVLYPQVRQSVISDSLSGKENSNAAHSILTSLRLSKNGMRKDGLNIKEHAGDLEPCLTSSDIPKAKMEPRKSKTTVENVNAEIFGDLLRKAKHLAEVANKSLPNIRLKQQLSKEAASYIDQTSAEMNLGIDIDDYRVLPGGHWIPLSCRPLWKVAIVVAFRNRFEHLPIFLRHTVPLLKRQQLEFSVFITEQRNDLPFNRAMLMNIGVIEALNFSYFDCVVFHDVDHLAMNAGNYYGCESMPKHFVSGLLDMNWNIPYDMNVYFGAVTGVTLSQFLAMNGLPNVYWGWGGEDNDLYFRVLANGLEPSRPEGEIGYFDRIYHDSKKSARLNSAKFCLNTFCSERMATDGLSNLEYEVPTIELHPLYTNISVNIQRLPWNPDWKTCDKMTMIAIPIVIIVALVWILMVVMLFIGFLKRIRLKWSL